MRYRLKAKVDGTLRLRRDLSIEADGVLTQFLRDKKGGLEAVSASTPVEAERFATSVGPGRGSSKATIELKADPAVYERLVRHLHALESHLAFSSGGALRRLHWDTAEEDREAETEDEEQHIAVTRFGRQVIDPRPTVVLEADAAISIVAACPANSEMVVPMAFWREAINELSDRRYIQAFYNFYFVIEGFYADGKSSEREVLKAFQRSRQLTEITEWVLQQIKRQERHRKNLDAFYREARCTRDVIGTQRLLIKTRGQLHHYFSGRTRRQPDPFGQDHFETPAWLALNFATMAILRRATGLPLIRPVS